MRKEDLVHHQRFSEMVALAAMGQLSSMEHEELRAHLAECAQCREEHDGYATLVFNYLPLMLPEVRANSDRSSDKFSVLPVSGNVNQASFATQSRKAGLRDRLTVTSGHPPVLSPLYRYAPGIAACAMLGATIFGFALWRADLRDRTQSAEIAKMGDQTKHLSDQVAQLQAGRDTTSSVLESKLLRSTHDNSRLSEQAKTLTEQLATASAKVQDLLAQVDASQGRETVLSARLKGEEQGLAQMRTELEGAQTERALEGAELERQQARLKELETSLADQAESIERERKLLAADRDIRDLMGARNLHILDVFDLDGNGQTRKTFGRVFYTEGQSLIFYAFDLGMDNKKRSTLDTSFQAWGAHESNHQLNQSLGIFYKDDQKNNRWVLKFTDPNVLAEINYVFVTVEPPGGSKKPTGPRLLYAYLNSGINHP